MYSWKLRKGPIDVKADFNNPVLFKELKLRFRSVKSFNGILFYLIAMCIFVLGFIFMTMNITGVSFFRPSESFILFTLLAFIQLGLVLFITPGLTAGLNQFGKGKTDFADFVDHVPELVADHYREIIYLQSPFYYC